MSNIIITCYKCKSKLHEDYFNQCCFCLKKEVCEMCEKLVALDQILDKYKEDIDIDKKFEENNEIYYYVCDDCTYKTIFHKYMFQKKDKCEIENCNNKQHILLGEWNICEMHYEKAMNKINKYFNNMNK